MSTGLVWLASYPKSGNTWMRAFLANLTDTEQSHPLHINEISTGAIASSREWFEEAIGFDSSELSHEEIDRLRPEVYRWSASRQETHEFHKIHDAWVRLPNGSPLFPSSQTKACLYIVRNPLDVCISLSHHNQITIDRAIDNMANPEYCLAGGTIKLHKQLRQKLLTWSEHVESWIEAPKLNIKVVRYEDMFFTPQKAFFAVSEFLGINEGDVSQAIDATQMKKLQTMERGSIFKERPQKATRFFRKGVSGDWKHVLRPDQIDSLVSAHGDMMARLGYLDCQGVPLVEPIAVDNSIPLVSSNC